MYAAVTFQIAKDTLLVGLLQRATVFLRAAYTEFSMRSSDRHAEEVHRAENDQSSHSWQESLTISIGYHTTLHASMATLSA